MLTAQFEYGGATYEVRPETVEDGLDTDVIRFILGNAEGQRERYKAGTFAHFILRTRVVKGTPSVPHPDPDAPPEELRAAYAAWRKADPALLAEWRLANNRASLTANDPDLQPELPEKNDETPAS